MLEDLVLLGLNPILSTQSELHSELGVTSSPHVELEKSIEAVSRSNRHDRSLAPFIVATNFSAWRVRNVQISTYMLLKSSSTLLKNRLPLQPFLVLLAPLEDWLVLKRRRIGKLSATCSFRHLGLMRFWSISTSTLPDRVAIRTHYEG